MWSEGWRMDTVAMQPKMAEGASLFRPTLATSKARLTATKSRVTEAQLGQIRRRVGLSIGVEG